MSNSIRVLMVGVGGIGHPCALALASERRVTLTLLDEDLVEQSNLHRLIGFDESHLGQRKTDALASVIKAQCGRDVSCIHQRFLPENALSLLSQHQLVIEGTDNFASKFLVADAAMIARVPVVHGAAVRWQGTVFSTLPMESSCYRCVFEEPPSGEALDCSTAGVFGPVTTVIGGLMALEALAILDGRTTGGSLLSFDGLRKKVRRTPLARRPDCALCGNLRSIDRIDVDRYLQQHC